MYGDVTKSYRFKKNPKLLNIGDADVRVMIENEIEKYDPTMLKYCDPNQQYSGTSANTKYHNLVKHIFGQEYDGTIIDEEQLHGNTKYPISELEGPSEIVIWKDYNELLEELPNDDIAKGINKSKSSTKRRRPKSSTKRRRPKSSTKRRRK
jgi:hypothetical protein